MTVPEPLSAATADAIYDVLVAHAGASDYGRGDFVFHQTSERPPTEYRFQGGLGFGGKFWRTKNGWYVTAYPEDVKAFPARRETIDRTNTELVELHERSVSLTRQESGHDRP